MDWQAISVTFGQALMVTDTVVVLAARAPSATAVLSRNANHAAIVDDLATGICHKQGAVLGIAHRPDQCLLPGVFLPRLQRNDEPDAGLYVAPGTAPDDDVSRLPPRARRPARKRLWLHDSYPR